MPEYIYAVCSALLWASSAPILNYGLRHIPQDNSRLTLAVCLLIANLTGIAVLFPFVEFEQTNWENLFFLVMAGLFTYPLATGLYYFTGIAFGNRMEIASQFAKVKPILSILLAYLFLRENIFSKNILPVVFIFIGVVLLLFSKPKDKIQTNAVMLGLGTALFWAIGEVFMKVGVMEHTSVYSNFIALCSGFIVFAVFVMANKTRESKIKFDPKWVIPFVLHGILSFAFAYALFFKSLKHIGLGNTVIINAFWPFLAIIITSIIRLVRRQKLDISLYTWAAVILILTGSLLQAMMVS